MGAFDKIRKRKRNPNAGVVTNNDSSDEDSNVVLPEPKKVKKEVVSETKTIKVNEDLAVKSNLNSEPTRNAGDITAIKDDNTALDRDARALAEKALQMNQEENKDGKEVYRGSNNYHQYIPKTMDQIRANKFTGTQGPIRAPAHINISNRFDYEPCICKDYKETGYCSFGDSCIFLHDRSDYKSGWEIERDYQEEERKKREALEKGEEYNPSDDDNKYIIESSSDDDEDGDNLPFACYMCKKEFVKPVVTNCHHYFCQKCALDYYKKSTKCACCGAQTSGCFNKAKNIEAKLKEKHERQLSKNNNNNSESDSDDHETSE
ncbi:hypothetical protein WA158_002770 [Blastocystis sp. Blastoise]